MLEEFFFSISKTQNIQHIGNQFVRKVSAFRDSPYVTFALRSNTCILYHLPKGKDRLSRSRNISVVEDVVCRFAPEHIDLGGLCLSVDFVLYMICHIGFGFTDSGAEWRKESGFYLRVKRWFSWLILEPTNHSFQIC